MHGVLGVSDRTGEREEPDQVVRIIWQNLFGCSGRETSLFRIVG